MEVSTAVPVRSVRQSVIELRTLGRIDLRDERRGELHTVMVQPKRLALLTYLLVENTGYHRRDTLLAMFWSERDTQHARGALRQALRFLRRALGDDAIINRGDEEVRINPDRVWSDTGAFEQAIEEGEFRRACSLYPGPFLNGFTLKDAPGFDEWVEQKRGELAARHREVLRVMAETAETPAESVRWLHVLATADPYNPKIALELIHGLCDVGDTSGALRHLKAHQEVVRRELGVEPNREFQQVARALETAALSSTGIRHRIQVAGEDEHDPGWLHFLKSRVGFVSILGVSSLGIAIWVAQPKPDPTLALIPPLEVIGPVEQPDFGLLTGMILAGELQKSGVLRVIDPSRVRTAASGPEPRLWYNFDELSHLARGFGAGRILHAAVTVVGDHVQVTACLCDVRHNLGPTAVVDYASETEAMNGMAELATSLVEALMDPPRSDLEPTERDQQIRR